MRVLVATTAGSGHFGPLVPFARACADAGHAVRVAAPASFAGAVQAARFEHVPFADVAPERLGAVFGRLPSLTPDEANRIVVAEVFGRLDAQAALPAVTATIDSWRPDVVVREPAELASWAAATAHDIPQVLVSIGLSGMRAVLLDALAEPLAELAALAGLPRGAAGPYDDVTTFSLVPPGFDDAADPTLFRFHDGSEPSGKPRLPAPWGDPALPLVYVSYGSVTATIGPFGGVYRATVDALADAPYRVLLTMGAGLDPAHLDPLPTNVHVERWWPQADVMPAASVVVGHGGFGTTMAALGAGLPQVVLPLFAADQFHNAARLSAVGAGVLIEGGITGASELPDAIERAHGDPAIRAMAESLAAEIAALPPPAAALPILEQLAGAN